MVPPQKIILRCISVVRDRSLIFNSDEDGMTECHTFMIGENSLLMVGDKDFKYEEFLKDEPETESKADLAKVMEKYMSSKNKVRRINNQTFCSDYQENGIFKFL